MNKLTKIGASALCGSLAAISAANAGDLSVTGGVDMSWVSFDNDTTGNPIGMGSNLTFTGSGELDNGWGVALSVATANLDAYSNTNVTVTVPTLGDIRIDQGTSGTGIDRMDDKTPNVWEEADGTGLTTGIQKIAGGSAGSTIEYTPNMMPDGITAVIAYSPNAGGSNAGDKAGSGDGSGATESSLEWTIEVDGGNVGVEGLTVYGGMATIKQDAANSSIDDDAEEETLGATYAAGNFTLGYQYSKDDLGRSASPQFYENTMYGITFQVNDDLSIGYNNIESEQDNGSSANVTAEASAFELAYTMGGASIRLAEASIDNKQYQSGTNRDATTLSVSLAF